MQKQAIILCICLITCFSISVSGQVPIDLSQAKEFKVVWKKQIGGDVLSPPKYIPNPCGNLGLDILSIGSSSGGAQFYTQPRIDTTRVVEGWGNVYRLFDYDGIPPLEYLNDNGRVDRCISNAYPFQKERIDTINCFSGSIQAEFSSDVDGDGYVDLVCDIGGGGKTASVIRGGPNVGEKCERMFYIPQVHGRSEFNITMDFWRSASNKWQVLQLERDSNAVSTWLVLYEVKITVDNSILKTTFIQTDSLYGNGVSVNDISVSDCAAIVDTLVRKDWLLIMRRLNDDKGPWVLERFDATEGKFNPTGEQVTGTEFLDPWNAGYTLGTDKPVVAFHATDVGTVYCYASDILHPFAWWSPVGSGIQPSSGKVAINDQTGDGVPDIIVTGGSPNGAIILLALDTSTTNVSDLQTRSSELKARIIGNLLEVNLTTSATISAQIVTTDGRMFPIMAPIEGQVGLNRFDLSIEFQKYPRGPNHLIVRVGGKSITINFLN